MLTLVHAKISPTTSAEPFAFSKYSVFVDTSQKTTFERVEMQKNYFDFQSFATPQDEDDVETFKAFDIVFDGDKGLIAKN